MAQSKAINKKSYYGSNASGGVPEIAMPPLEQTPPVAQQSPDPWAQQTVNVVDSNTPQPLFAVPEQIPQDVAAAMDKQDTELPDQSTAQNEQAPAEQAVVEPRHAESAKASPQESFRAIREAKERAEQERNALLSQMLEMQARINASGQPQQVKAETQAPEDDFNLDIEPDALVEGRYVQKVANKLKSLELKQRELVAQLQKSQARTDEATLETRLKVQYSDFEKVVTRENIEALNEQYPQIAMALRDTPDAYNKAVSAYTVIKQFGIHKEDVYANDRAQALINSKKPRPLTSVSPQQGDSPMSKANAFANGLTDELKEQLRREMREARKVM